jgi:hypothetical protein
MMGQIKNIGLTALGLGAGARGIMGLYNLMRRQQGPKTRSVMPVPVDVPYPTKQKQAFDIGQFFKGDYANSYAEIPWAIPAATAAGVGGLAGGWSMLDGILDQRRKGRLDTDLEKARSDFDQALLAQYDKPKTAAAELANELDKLYDNAVAASKTEKAASGIAGPAGALTGMGLTIGGLGAVATAMAVYNAVKKRNTDSLLESAQKRRQRANFRANPTQLWARPTPVEVQAPGAL